MNVAACQCERSAAISIRGIVAVGLLLFPIVSTAGAKYSGGTGEPNDPYQIATAADLIALGETPADYDKHFILTADLDLDPNLPGRKVFDKAAIPTQGRNFYGVFDGNGHKILHLTIMGTSCLGVFGDLPPQAEVRNLAVVDVNITGSLGDVGGLVGRNSGILTNCYCSGAVTSPWSSLGGLVGENFGTVAGCHSAVVVSGTSFYVGGLIGFNHAGTVTDCRFAGAVSSDSQAIGGIVGYNDGGDVTDCSSTGPVTSTGIRVGGLIGVNHAGTVTDCNCTGMVTAEDDVGGLIGSNDGGTVIDCHASATVSGENSVGGLVGSNTGPLSHCSSGGSVSGEGVAGGLMGGNGASVTACYSTSAVRGSGYVGGLMGINSSDSVTNCHSAGRVTISGGVAGGLVGENRGSLTQCYSTSEVGGTGGYFGGLVGWNHASVAACYSTGPVTGDGVVGGLVGENQGSLIQCYSTSEVGGTGGYLGGLVGSNDASVADCYSTGAVTGSKAVIGGLVGSNRERGTLTRSYSIGAVSSTWDYAGGLVGSNRGIVTGCHSTATITAGRDVGGLVGYNGGTVTQSYSAGAVDGNDEVGGLVGRNCSGSVVNKSYSTGVVSGIVWVGGLLGFNDGTVEQCYAAGRVTGEEYVGGLLGYVWHGDVRHCFWDAQTSGQAESAGGVGKTTGEMQMAKTFLDAGWDFVGETANGTEGIWWVNEGKSYPRLSWEGPAGMVFADIPAGTFEMGNHHDPGPGNARPSHAVTLDGFQMSRYETTNAQYAEYLNGALAGGLIQVVNGAVYAASDANLAVPYCDMYASSSYSQIEYSQGRFTVRSRDGLAMADHPVARVTWFGATAFCEYYGWRLPTEAEWEYAARGGYHDPYFRYPWGSDSIDCSQANCKTASGFCNPLNLTSWPYTVPVGYYGPQGAYGLCDMSGNLSEWCQDWYDAGYYSVSPARNPPGPAAGTYRVVRGGAWDVDGNSCDVEGRGVGDLLVRAQVLGFRVCR